MFVVLLYFICFPNITTKEVRSFDWGNETSGIDYGKLQAHEF